MTTPDPEQQFEDPDSFPDPDEDGGGAELEVEIVEDTPEEDRNAARPAGDRVDVDSDEFEREVRSYGNEAQQRIKAVKFEYHEERRAKESAVKQSEEAVKYAEQVSSDNNALRKSLENSNTVLIEQYGARSDAELEAARQQFKEAYEGGETDALLEAQENLSRLHAERVKALADAERLQRPQAQAQGKQVQQPQAQQQQANQGPPVDIRAMNWLNSNNDWYQHPDHPDMTGYAVGLHQQLVKRGFNPQIHEEYYAEIDKGMRTVFPEFTFSGKTSDGDQRGNGERPSAVTHKKKSSTPVGGPTRGGNSSRKVQLTRTQVALAKRLGLSNKRYAAQVAKEMSNG